MDKNAFIRDGRIVAGDLDANHFCVQFAMLDGVQVQMGAGFGDYLDAAFPAPQPARRVVRVIFDGPPSHESGRFVECEDEQGRGIRAGEWKELPNGLWELRIELEAHTPSRDVAGILAEAERASDVLNRGVGDNSFARLIDNLATALRDAEAARVRFQRDARDAQASLVESAGQINTLRAQLDAVTRERDDAREISGKYEDRYFSANADREALLQQLDETRERAKEFKAALVATREQRAAPSSAK